MQRKGDKNMFLKLNLFKALIKKEWQGAGLVVGFDFDNLRMEQVEVIGNVFDNPELLEV